MTDSRATTDVERADAFLNAYGAEVRYSPDLASWFLWDGARWKLDTLNRIATMARLSGLCPTDRGQEAFVRQAGKDPAIIVPGERWDADPWLLTCENVTVDLRTGAVKSHDPADLSTRLASVTYVPGAEAPLWEAFLARIMDGNKHMVGYLQRVLGYCLTGVTSEQVFWLFHGFGANGKSTLVDTVAHILGEYAATAPEGLLLGRKEDPHPAELMTLQGQRLVLVPEPDRTRRLYVSRVKQLTGGDPITGRPMYGKYVTFAPTHKFVMHANHRPTIGESSDAIWRRMLPVEFGVQIPELERDKALGEKLNAEAPGILNWLMAGCKDWQSGGLRTPPEVLSAIDAYRTDDNVNAGFFTDILQLQDGAWASSADVRSAYGSYVNRTGVPPADTLGPNDLADQVRRMGAKRDQRKVGGRKERGYWGVRIQEGEGSWKAAGGGF